MNATIERLDITPVQKERAQRIYDYYCDKIDQNDGSYKMGRLKDECKEFDIGSTTFYHDLKNLIDAGLLAKEGQMLPVLSMPVLSMPVDEVAGGGDFYEWKAKCASEYEPDSDDDFKPLATMEMDGWEIVDEQDEKWIRQKELSAHLGYADSDGVSKVYERHSGDFKETDSTTVNLTGVDGKEREVRIFSFRGCLKVCRHSDMPAANEVMDQLYDLAEKVRKGELISVDSHIAKWQDRLMIGVIEPKLTEMEDEIGTTKQHVNQLETKVDDVTQKVDALTNNEVNNLIQADVDQYTHIDAYLISYQDGIAFGDAIAGLRRKIKGRYRLPLKCKTTEIPPRLLNTVSYDLHRSVLKRMDEHPDFFYRLKSQHQNFLISKGYTQL